MEKLIETKVGGWLITVTLKNNTYTVSEVCLYDDQDTIIRQFNNLKVVLDVYSDSVQRRLIEY